MKNHLEHNVRIENKEWILWAIWHHKIISYHLFVYLSNIYKQLQKNSNFLLQNWTVHKWNLLFLSHKRYILFFAYCLFLFWVISSILLQFTGSIRAVVFWLLDPISFYRMLCVPCWVFIWFCWCFLPLYHFKSIISFRSR